LYLSGYIEAHRGEYYEALQRVRTDGDWVGWLRFFLVGVVETSREGVRQAGDLMSLREKLRKRLLKQARALVLLDVLFANPYLTVVRAEKILEVSNPTARQAVRALVDAGVLEEISGRSWGRLYLARPILRAIQGDEETL
ncbi:MAG: Fic family protein, partial [Candidatus Rokuibacteriota bacterium]